MSDVMLGGEALGLSNYETSQSSGFGTGGGEEGGNDWGTAASGAGAGLGLAFSAYGAYNQYQAAKQSATASKAIAGLEQQQDLVRQTAMHVAARRQQMQVLRNSQQAGALALNNATNQGASQSQSSGLAGGYGQIGGRSGNDILGINQNLEAGDQMFALNRQISQQKMNIADAQSQAALGSGLSSFGGNFGKAIGPLFNLGMQLGTFV